MRLVNCHIENFGKISDQSFDFSKDCIQICQENGWGKSTLAAFIRVMFYGFAGEGKRNDVENERKHFKPWQGGVYGGTLTFEVNGKRYQIYRTFGTKEKEDVFVLRDAATNLESKDFTRKIGEELFQIDLDSFCRTVFISQNDCQTSTNGSINAKLGNLAENTDDINNFEKVDEKLKSLLNGMSPTRKQGSLYKLKDEIAHIEQEIKQSVLLDHSIDEINQKMNLLKKEKEDLQIRLSELQEKQKAVSVYQDTKAQREKYEAACKQMEVRKANLKEQREYFPGMIPVDWELNDQIERSGDLDVCEESVRRFQLSEKEKSDYQRLEKVFTDQIPEEADLKNCKDRIKTMNELQLFLAQNKLTQDQEEKLQMYESQIGTPIPKEHEILHYVSQWSLRNHMKSELPAKEQEVQTIKNKIEQSKANGNRKSPMTLVGLLLLLAGIGGLFFHTVVGCLVIGVGFLLALAGVYLQTVKKKEYTQEQKEYQRQLKELEKSISLGSGKASSVESDVKHFLNKYQMSYGEDTVVAQLYELKNQCKEYQDLLAKKDMLSAGDGYQNYQVLKNSVETYLLAFYPAEVVRKNPYMEVIFALEKHKELYLSIQMKQKQSQAAQERHRVVSRQLYSYITGLSFTVSESVRSQLLEIKEHLQQYKIALQEYENARNVKEQLEYSMGNVQAFAAIQIQEQEADESLENLADAMKAYNDRLQEVHESMSQYMRQLNIHQEKRAQIGEDEEQLEFLREQYKEGILKYKRIEKTKEFLGLAKESFTAKYMEPIMSGFRKYYQLLTGKEASQYRIDANTQLTVKEQGLQRNPKVFSTGYQDLMGICMRMALVDAMYSQEKPFLIFDDPFVNLDEEKTKGGIAFLAEISKEYQVIYFTCHESRCTK